MLYVEYTLYTSRFTVTFAAYGVTLFAYAVMFVVLVYTKSQIKCQGFSVPYVTVVFWATLMYNFHRADRWNRGRHRYHVFVNLLTFFGYSNNQEFPSNLHTNRDIICKTYEYVR